MSHINTTLCDTKSSIIPTPLVTNNPSKLKVTFSVRGVISPLLANLFLHYAFDQWMRRRYPSIPFERYADDIILHCKSERQAKWIRSAIERRLSQCKLEPHPEKTSA